MHIPNFYSESEQVQLLGSGHPKERTSVVTYMFCGLRPRCSMAGRCMCVYCNQRAGDDRHPNHFMFCGLRFRYSTAGQCMCMYGYQQFPFPFSAGSIGLVNICERSQSVFIFGLNI